ncbi:small G protein signaling modulator 1-like [Sesamum indicum]|uniref:Small G protein signaling modulator 1-like n=1 Tax=Sesamum indicum TaxID=4182 RepID=A0A6I9UDB6_SESIN|nr:small G protein signaling modulator 1-like [Sesamum indicum]XP_011097916.1 small G protein signaling modulator 1-like [Sesamum indicum]
MMWRDPGTPADDYYQVRPECKDVPESKFRIKAGKTLSARKWNAAFAPDGVLDIGKTLNRIHRGGIHPSIRGEVWEFLLGCYDPKSTYEEREEIREQRRAKYEILKEVCKKMFPLIGSGKFVTAPIIKENGEPTEDPIVLQQISLAKEDGAEEHSDVPMSKKEIEWKLTLHQIGLDVVRTDRTLVFYESQENLAKLWDILSVYSWFDGDVGYCQGMSDLCSPMIMLLENEGDAFWCFERLMRRLRGNFRCTEDSVGVESQLSNLASVTQVIDPKLHQHLETLGGGDYLFAFRMLMVLFRREFSFGDSLYLWEMMWALEYDPDLFLMYEEDLEACERPDGTKGKGKSRKQCGKYERENMRNGGAAPLPISVFLVASVLKDKSTKLLTEARGLDDVVKILNDMTGNLDAKKACINAMKLHKKYLKKAKN